MSASRIRGRCGDGARHSDTLGDACALSPRRRGLPRRRPATAGPLPTIGQCSTPCTRCCAGAGRAPDAGHQPRPRRRARGHRAAAPARRPHAGADAERLAAPAAAATRAGLARDARRPAGLVRRCRASTRPTWRCSVDAANPALLLARMLGGEPPPVQIDGDAQLAGDVNWLLQNLRWDVAADLERLFGPVVAQQLHQVGRTRRRRHAHGDPHRRRARRAAALAPGLTSAVDASTRTAGLHRRHRPALRPGRGGAVGLSASAGCGRWCASSPSGAGWTRRAASGCARGWSGWGRSSSSSARCCRRGAT